MKHLSKQFNAEASLHDLNASIESQIDALRSTEMGALRTLASTAKSSLKLRKAMGQLARGLDIPSEGKSPWDIINAIAAKTDEQKVPGAERLKQLQEWNKAFWTRDDVKQADHDARHQFKAIKTIKQIAQQQPKP